MLVLCIPMSGCLIFTDFVLAYEETTETKSDYEAEKKKSVIRKKFLMGLLRAGLEMERVIYNR